MSGVIRTTSKEEPWCWQSKRIRDRIREAFDATKNVASALGVYDALTEVSSDMHSAARFQTTHAYIASKSGVSQRTVGDIVKALNEIGIIKVECPALRAPCWYTLLPLGSDCGTSSNGCETLSNECRAFGNDRKQGPLPTLEEIEEKKENQKKVVQGNDAAAPVAPAVAVNSFALSSEPARAVRKVGVKLTDSEWLDTLRTESAYAGIDIDREHGKWAVWCRERRKQLTRLRFINWLNRAEKPLTSYNAGQRPSPRSTQREPNGWKEWLETNRPGNAYSSGGEHEDKRWDQLTPDVQRWIKNQMESIP